MLDANAWCNADNTRSVRTKKIATVEDRLRQALGVQLAIGGVPQTKDGTVITSNNRAPTPPLPGSPGSSNGTDEKAQPTTQESNAAGGPQEGMKRRTTLTFGNVTDKPKGRERGVTLAAPPSGTNMEGGMELKEVASQPRVV